MCDEDKPHFMALSEGPAKQFVALVDYNSGIIREQMDQIQLPVKNQKDCFYLDNYYYCAKYGIKTFKNVADVKKEFDANQTPLCCLFVAFKTAADLQEVNQVAKEINVDTKVLVIESRSKYLQYEKAENFAAECGFDVVYLTSTSEQLADARQCSEKTGVDRLMECLQVCNWPWRNASCFPKVPVTHNPDLTVVQEILQTPFTAFLEENKSEFQVDEDDSMDEAAVDMLMMSVTGWMANRPQRPVNDPVLPAPQHAERVHLSPDSPTTTEGTTRGDDDVSISVDFDLVCAKTNEESQGNAQKSQPSSSAKGSKASKKNHKKH